MNVIKKHMYKFRNASPAIKASMALLFANLILKGLSMISGPIFTRLMPAQEYGIVSTFSSWQSMFGVLVTFNLASGVFNNGMLDFKDDRDSFQFSLLVVSSISTVFWFSLYCIFPTIFRDVLVLPDILICFMFAYFLLAPAYQYWSGRQRYEFKYKLLSCIIVGISVFSILFGIIFVMYSDEGGKGVSKVVATESVYLIIGGIFYGYTAYKSKLKCKLEYCVYALKFNLPLIPHYLSMYALAQADRVIITQIIGTAETAIYSVAYTVAAVINIVWQSIDASLSPWIYEKLAQKKQKDVQKITVLVVLLFSILSLVTALFSPEIMVILAPSSYQRGVYVIPSVSAGVYFTAVYSLYMRIELFFKQTKFSMVATSIAAMLNIVLNYIFIPIFGFEAAGYTTLFCYVILYLLHYANVRKLGFHYVLNNKAIAVISAITIIGAIVISISYKWTSVRFTLIIFLGLLAVVLRKRIVEIFSLIKEK